MDTLQTEDGISLRELSRRVVIPVSTCRKIVNQLVEEGRITKAEMLINGRVHHLIYVVKVEVLAHTVFLFKSIEV
jgi:DNA-binding Lrp family transcriptional regulator